MECSPGTAQGSVFKAPTGKRPRRSLRLGARANAIRATRRRTSGWSKARPNAAGAIQRHGGAPNQWHTPTSGASYGGRFPRQSSERRSDAPAPSLVGSGPARWHAGASWNQESSVSRGANAASANPRARSAETPMTDQGGSGCRGHRTAAGRSGGKRCAADAPSPPPPPCRRDAAPARGARGAPAYPDAS